MSFRTVLILISIYIFFFQAEDGIRDWSVTGVQTCALPISGSQFRAFSCRPPKHAAVVAQGEVLEPRAARERKIEDSVVEIGRASCKEREYIYVVGELLEKK